MENTKEKKGLNISAKSFITAIAIILGIMVLCYILTFIVPAGEYVTLANGSSNYQEIGKASFPFYKWILSPFLVFGSNDGLTIIVLLIFLMIIGGVFNCLNKSGLMQYLIDKITDKFKNNRYLLVAIISLFFMTMGSVIGSFEEVVPLVPIIVALSIKLGFDALTGLGMSLLSIGAGFAAGVCNPFTVGVAQGFVNGIASSLNISELPMFSGLWLRLIAFVLIYGLLVCTLIMHAKKVDTRPELSMLEFSKFENNPKFNKGTIYFVCILGLGLIIVFLSSVISIIQKYTTVIIALMFLVSGTVASIVSGMTFKDFLIKFMDGIVSILPAILLVLMASSIKFILEQSKILDTILFNIINAFEVLPKPAIILCIYLFVLIMNFFISSALAKATMLIPLIIPLATYYGISAQLCVLAFIFGDGFSNVFYPTNPVLLISLGITDTSYGKWVKYSWLFQLLTLILTALLLLFGYSIGY